MQRDELACLGRVAGAGAALLAPTALAWLERAALTARQATAVDRALAHLGVRARARSIATLGGGRANLVWAIELDPPRAARRVVLKRALHLGSLLALGARWAGAQPFSLDSSPRARIAREAWALARLRAAGVRVPQVLAAAPAHGLLLTEQLGGVPLPRALAQAPERWAARYAAAIRATHDAGLALTDGHPGNALAQPDGELALLDLELAEPLDTAVDPTRRRAFDVAYAAQFLTSREQPAFLAAFADLDLRAEQRRLAPYARLFARERRRQRGAAR